MLAYLIALRVSLPLAMKIFSLPTIFRMLGSREPWLAPAEALDSVAASERWAARMRVPNTCLYRALARWAALTRAGVPARFFLGIRRDAPESGHAWVEVDGVPVGEAADASLVVTFSHPPRGG